MDTFMSGVDRAEFERYLTIKRFRNAMVRHHPFFVFARWLVREHPNWAIAGSGLLTLGLIGMMIFVG